MVRRPRVGVGSSVDVGDGVEDLSSSSSWMTSPCLLLLLLLRLESLPRRTKTKTTTTQDAMRRVQEKDAYVYLRVDVLDSMDEEAAWQLVSVMVPFVALSTRDM